VDRAGGPGHVTWLVDRLTGERVAAVVPVSRAARMRQVPPPPARASARPATSQSAANHAGGTS
jgi:hypothetical protein